MKNKPITIALIASVVLIWGWIMYSVFDFVGSPEIITSKKKSLVSVIKDDSVLSAYDLLLNYKDPFLKKEYSASLSSSKNINYSTVSALPMLATKKAANLDLVVKEEFIPAVAYLGRIQNEKLKKPVAILLINNNEYMMKEGEVNEGVLLKHILNDSLEIIFEKKILYVRKK
jgi:hypothetical protein